MLNIQLQVQPQTERRLRKMLEGISDQEMFAQHVINYHITELKKGILNIRLDLMQFEDKYHLSSQEFYQQFERGEQGDSEDAMIWAGLYELFRENEQRLQEFL